MLKHIIYFFDKLEDKIRARLSHTPLLYALLGGIGVVLFWRGVWHLADNANMPAIVSMILGSAILLLTGAFVSSFIGSRLIISGLSGDKKIAEKTKEEIQTEEQQIQKLQSTVERVEKKLETLETEVLEK